ncbi:response regulator [Clostridium hydrogeniformans]|uniref:response regulator n=1 Tax=Clostridium hydrogeniformans TaxID=349933 RepID=UPI0004814BCE|nr:response regulator [Clostridium hydrogeniformans]
MRTIIIDDEEPVLQLMKIIMRKNKHLDIVGEFTDSKKALEGILKLLPDVVFIDIEMPCMDGIELANKILEFDENIQIVFVTAYEKYALEAFKVNAVNYILKPIIEKELNATVKRLLRNYSVRVDDFIENKSNKILSLGTFKVYGKKDKLISWSTAKVQELFAYFVYMRGEEIDKWILCDILWPDYLPKKAEHNLHSTIYRLKASLKSVDIENVVKYRKGKYSIDLNNFNCDSWEFENFIKDNPIVNEENIESYDKSIELYKGRLFGDEGYTWSIELSEKLGLYYLEGIKNIAIYYMGKNSYNTSEKYLKKVIKEDPFNEKNNELMMKLYFDSGSKVNLVNCYRNLKKLLKDELDISPKVSTIKLYNELISNL